MPGETVASRDLRLRRLAIKGTHLDGQLLWNQLGHEYPTNDEYGVTIMRAQSDLCPDALTASKQHIRMAINHCDVQGRRALGASRGVDAQAKSWKLDAFVAGKKKQDLDQSCLDIGYLYSVYKITAGPLLLSPYSSVGIPSSSPGSLYEPPSGFA